MQPDRSNQSDILDDLSDQERDSIKVWINQTVERLLSFIDFVFVEGAHFTELKKTPSDRFVFNQTLDKEIMKLSESSRLRLMVV